MGGCSVGLRVWLGGGRLGVRCLHVAFGFGAPIRITVEMQDFGNRTQGGLGFDLRGFRDVAVPMLAIAHDFGVWFLGGLCSQ